MRRPWLHLVLAASLLFNLFAAGAIGGVVLMLRHPGLWHGHAVAAHPIREAGDALPPEARLRFRAILRAVNDQSVELVRQARQSRREAAQLFTAPVFNPDAVNAALERAREADVTLRGRLENAAVLFAAGLSADERVLLAEGLAHGGPLRQPPRAPRSRSR